MKIDDVLKWLDTCTDEERAMVLARLRWKRPLHRLEEEIGLPAEAILDAIGEAAGLTLRMLRGVLAEAAFAHRVVAGSRWNDKTPPGDHAYDYLLDDGQGPFRVQVKLQRSKEGRPMTAREALRRLPADQFVVETWKTRGGTSAGGQTTRPYRFGEFDLLAVSMQPSTGDWGRFHYTVEAWLIPNPTHPDQLLKYQPVAASPNEDWTDDLHTAVRWLRSGEKKQISGWSG
jgi:hypothetical protein